MISCGSKEGGDDHSKTVDSVKSMQYAQTFAGAASSEENGLTDNRPWFRRKSNSCSNYVAYSALQYTIRRGEAPITGKKGHKGR